VAVICARSKIFLFACGACSGLFACGALVYPAAAVTSSNLALTVADFLMAMHAVFCNFKDEHKGGEDGVDVKEGLDGQLARWNSAPTAPAAHAATAANSPDAANAANIDHTTCTSIALHLHSTYRDQTAPLSAAVQPGQRKRGRVDTLAVGVTSDVYATTAPSSGRCSAANILLLRVHSCRMQAFSPAAAAAAAPPSHPTRSPRRGWCLLLMAKHG
jgi:hypothetical protein